jgi:hypothetical protein
VIVAGAGTFCYSFSLVYVYSIKLPKTANDKNHRVISQRIQSKSSFLSNNNNNYEAECRIYLRHLFSQKKTEIRRFTALLSN